MKESKKGLTNKGVYALVSPPGGGLINRFDLAIEIRHMSEFEGFSGYQ